MVKVGQSFIMYKEHPEEGIHPQTCVSSLALDSGYTGKYALDYISVGGNQLCSDLNLVGCGLTFDEIHTRYIEYTAPFAGKFVETTDNIAFKRYSNEIFFYMYTLGRIYIHKQLVSPVPEKQPDIGESPQKAISHLEVYYPYSRIGTKDNITLYRNLITQETVILNDFEVVCAKWDGIIGDRYKLWAQDIKLIILNEKRIAEAYKTWGKRIRITATGATEVEISSYKAQYETTDPYLILTGAMLGSEDIDTGAAIKSEEIDGMLVAHYRMADRILHSHGVISNINRKNERLTAGEQVTYTQAIADKDQLTENQLLVLASDIKDVWGDQLKFEINRPDNVQTQQQNNQDKTHESDTTSDEL